MRADNFHEDGFREETSVSCPAFHQNIHFPGNGFFVGITKG
jgi:hypothetical protein